jgi:hypothetical protein
MIPRPLSRIYAVVLLLTGVTPAADNDKIKHVLLISVDGLHAPMSSTMSKIIPTQR